MSDLGGRASFDLIVEGGEVLDGSGRPAGRADIGVRSGRIAAVERLDGASADRRLDARGRIVAPGFVDIHSHSDFTLLVDPQAESALAQGVTTEIVGNCGHGCAPIGLEEDPRFTANIYGWAPDVRSIEWRTVGGYLDALDAARSAINVGTIVPLGNLRLMLLDDVRYPAAAADVRRLVRDLDRALDDGALGLSSGLEYPAEHAASTEELDALCARTAARDRFYATHTRDRGRLVVEGTAEGITTARRTGVRTQVSHILARRGSGGPDANQRIATLLEQAGAEGLPVAWDVHTRLFGITNLSTAVSPAVLAMPHREQILALRDRAAIRIDQADDTGRQVRRRRLGLHVHPRNRCGPRAPGDPFRRRRRFTDQPRPDRCPSRRAPRGRRPGRRSSADGDGHDLHGIGHCRCDSDLALCHRVGRHDDESRRSAAGADASRGVHLGGVLPASDGA